MPEKKFWKSLLNFQNDHRKSTMNSLNLSTPSLPNEKPEKRQWETHFSAKIRFCVLSATSGRGGVKKRV